jgi:YD repeat-containing protein
MPLGQKSTKQFDGQNHTVLVTDPRQNSTSYSYDGNNNLATTTNALLNPTTFIYDPQYFRLTDINDTLLTIPILTTMRPITAP